jgi:hypothetical protein
MTSKKYYIAQIETYYAVIGLADTEAEAVRVAAERAKKYLDLAGATDPYTGEPWTVQGINRYFGVNVTELEMNTAILEGVEG